MYSILSHIGQKMVEMLHYPAVWLVGLGLFIADAVSGGGDRLGVLTYFRCGGSCDCDDRNVILPRKPKQPRGKNGQFVKKQNKR